jgi:hypothetical protein
VKEEGRRPAKWMEVEVFVAVVVVVGASETKISLWFVII